MDLSGRKSFVFLPAEGERVNELFDDIQDVYRNRISLSFFQNSLYEFSLEDRGGLDVDALEVAGILHPSSESEEKEEETKERFEMPSTAMLANWIFFLFV